LVFVFFSVTLFVKLPNAVAALVRAESTPLTFCTIGKPVAGSMAAGVTIGKPVAGSMAAGVKIGKPVAGSMAAGVTIGKPVAGSMAAGVTIGKPVAGSMAAGGAGVTPPGLFELLILPSSRKSYNLSIP
jgi:hypothetical protein